jgi:hypothetical protein
MAVVLENATAIELHFGKNEDSPQQATGYQKEDNPEPARSKLRGIAPKEIELLFDK